MIVARRASLIAEILSTYVRARRRLTRSGLPATLAELRSVEATAEPLEVDPRTLGIRLGRATVRTLSLLPTDSRCLMRSLVLSGLLARRGIESKLVLAARPGDSFAAHAWVEHEGRPLLEPAHPPMERLTEV